MSAIPKDKVLIEHFFLTQSGQKLLTRPTRILGKPFWIASAITAILSVAAIFYPVSENQMVPIRTVEERKIFGIKVQNILFGSAVIGMLMVIRLFIRAIPIYVEVRRYSGINS